MAAVPPQQAAASAAQAPGSAGQGSGSLTKMRASPEQAQVAAVKTADNTSNIYTFLTKHLRNVGKNVERIVQHFKIKKGVVGENVEERGGRGILGKLKNFLTNPIGAMRDMVIWAFDGMRKAIDKSIGFVTKMLTWPFKILMKGVKMLNDFVGGIRKNFGQIFGAVKDVIVGTITTAAKAASVVIKETASAIGSAVTSVAKAIPAVASALTSAATSVLKTAGTLAYEATKILGQVTVAVLKMGGEMIRTAISVTKDVVTTLARVTFDAIGTAFNALTGRGGKGGKTAPLTPVYVVGGYLAGTEGGAKSMAEAKASVGASPRRLLRTAAGAVAGAATGTGPLGALLGALGGFFSPEIGEKLAEGKLSIVTAMKRAKNRLMGPFKRAEREAKAEGKGEGIAARARGALDSAHEKLAEMREKAKESGGFEAVRDRTKKMAESIKEFKWKERLLGASEKTGEHLGKIRAGFASFGQWIMRLFPLMLSGITALVEFFTKGKFISMLGSVFGKGGMIAKGAGMVKDAAVGAGGMLKRGAQAIGKGGWKGVGIGAVAGIGGSLIKGAADDMEDGAAKTAVKTGGAMLEYGGMGAMIGSVIPGVGTAVGAGVGAAVGAVVENWDAIVDGAKSLWEKTKKAGRTISEAFSTLGGIAKNAGKAVWSHFFGNDVEIDEKTGKVVRQEKSNLLGRMWEGLVGTEQKQLSDGQIVKEGSLGLLGNVNNVLMNTVGVFGKMLSGDEWSAGDFVKGTVLEGITTKISDALTSFWEGLMGIKDGLVNGFKYVTELRFVDDIKSAVTSWWNGEDESQKKPEGGSEFVGPADTRTWYQKLGQKMTSWADDNKSKVETVTVDKQGNQIANRAAGGPLGRNGTLVGELGPELLDANGNVVAGGRAGGKFQNPQAVKVAQEREDSILGILRDIRDNTFFAASYGEATAVSSMAASPEELNGVRGRIGQLKNADASSGFRPGDAVGNAITAVSSKIQAVMDAGGPEDDSVFGKAKEIGSSLFNTAGEVGGHVLGAAKGAAGSIWSGVKSAASAAASGDLKGAASALGQGFKDAGTAVQAGISGASGAISSGAADIGSIVKGDGKKNFEFLKGFIQQNGITDPKEQAMFLSQLDHESGGFRVLSENLNYKPATLLKIFPKYFRSAEEAAQTAAGGPQAIANRVYGGRMGNKDQGDGFKYRGRGFIQLTGRDNYAQASKDLGVDLVGNPDLASQPETAAKIALWYWKRRGLSAPAQAGDVEKVTRGINGGTIGLDDRKSKFAKYLGIMKDGGGTMMANSGAAPVKSAMFGGVFDGLPTLVGEREPEVLGADGRIHPSVSSFLNGHSSEASSLAMTTALKEAARRASGGLDHSGASEAMEKIAKAAGGGMGDEVMREILEVLRSIAANTGRSADNALTPDALKAIVGTTQQAQAPQPSNVNVNGGNVFAMRQADASRGMSGPMQRLVYGG